MVTTNLQQVHTQKEKAMQTQKTIEKINGTKSWFFDQFLTRLIKNKGRGLKLIKVEMKKENSQRTLQKYKRTHKRFSTSNHMLIKRTAQKIQTFLERNNLASTEPEIENMSKPITSTDMETVI